MQSAVLRFILVLPALLLLCACRAVPGADGPSDGRLDGPPDALLGRWILVALGHDPVEPLSGGRAPDLEVATDGRIGGFAGVNRFGGRLDLARLADGEFDPGVVVTTLMAGPEEAMEVERRFLSALERAEGFEVGERELRLMRGDGTVARFERGP